MTVKSYTDNTKNTAAKIVWALQSECDVKYWTSAKLDACNGVATPWGYGAITQYSAQTKGSVRAWHFLADYQTDITKNFAVRTGDELEVLFYEFVDRSVGATAASTAYANTDEIRWSVWTGKVTGGHSIVVSGAAFMTAVVACLF